MISGKKGAILRMMSASVMWCAISILSSACQNDATASPNYRNSEPPAEQKLTAPPPIPEEMFFAQEQVPLNYADVRESLDWELSVGANWHSHILLILKRAGRYFPIIEPILKSHGVPEDFKYLAVAESSLDPLASSPAGAKGLWQFIEGTGKDYGLRIDKEVDERYNLEKATSAACKYLIEAKQLTGSWAGAAAAYNMGKKGVTRQQEEQRHESYYNLYLNRETARYVFRILALKLIIESPEVYGFTVPQESRYSPLPYKELKVDKSIESLADFAKSHHSSYKSLRWLNPWLRGKSLTVEPGQEYTLHLLTDKARKEVYKK